RRAGNGGARARPGIRRRHAGSRSARRTHHRTRCARAATRARAAAPTATAVRSETDGSRRARAEIRPTSSRFALGRNDLELGAAVLGPALFGVVGRPRLLVA